MSRHYRLADELMAMVRRQPEKASGPLTVAAMLVAFAIVGKPVGILGIGWITVRLGIAQLPHGARWPQLAGASMLAGIGFTMSLFFAGVAFGTSDALALSAEVGILVGSVASAVFGIAFLAAIAARRTKPGENEDMSRHSACCSGGPNRSIRND